MSPQRAAALCRGHDALPPAPVPVGLDPGHGLGSFEIVAGPVQVTGLGREPRQHGVAVRHPQSLHDGVEVVVPSAEQERRHEERADHRRGLAVAALGQDPDQLVHDPLAVVEPAFVHRHEGVPHQRQPLELGLSQALGEERRDASGLLGLRQVPDREAGVHAHLRGTDGQCVVPVCRGDAIHVEGDGEHLGHRVGAVERPDPGEHDASGQLVVTAGSGDPHRLLGTGRPGLGIVDPVPQLGQPGQEQRPIAARLRSRRPALVRRARWPDR